MGKTAFIFWFSSWSCFTQWPHFLPNASSSSGNTGPHEDFKHLLKMDHGVSDPSTAAFAQASFSTSKSASNHSWLIDNPHLFSKFHVFSQPWQIILADGRTLPALGHGRVELSKYLYLDDVLLVPSLPTSLLSVQRLCSSLNCTSHFTKSGCVFQVVAPQMEIGHGYSSRGLYYLLLNNPASTSYAAVFPAYCSSMA